MPRPDVIVVGAGFAGLSAAVRLAGHGARVLVVEERRRLGGRATAFTDPQTGETVDNGQHALFGCYDETFAFLRAIGADEDVRLDEQLDLEIIDAAGQRSRLRTRDLPPPLHLVGGLLGWSALGVRDRVAALRLGLALRRLHDQIRRNALPADLATVTVSDWLVSQGQTARLIEILWEPLAIAALNQSPRIASAEPFVVVMARMFLGSRRDAAIGLPTKPLDELYAAPARRFLEARGSGIRTGTAATLVAEGNRVIGVDLRGERVEADAVIASVPWFAFPAFAADLPAARSIANAAGRMDPSPIVTVNLWLDERVTDVPFIGLPGRTFQWAFDKARIFGDAASHLSLISSGADEIAGLTNDQLIALARRELDAAIPAAARARVVRATAVREKRASFSLAPGQPTRPGTETAISGLFLAGDWTATGLPATIEGAVLSGHRAADVALGRRRP